MSTENTDVTLTVTASAVETVKLPQVFFIDFTGGGDLSYDNGEYTRTVSMSAAKFTADEQEYIVSALNAANTDTGVVYTLEKPVSGEYSVIYVGSTTSFDDLGAFKGLAETIDVGNQIANDEAFVNTKYIASADDAVSVIAHEAGHLMGEAHEITTGTIDDFATVSSQVWVTTNDTNLGTNERYSVDTAETMISKSGAVYFAGNYTAYGTNLAFESCFGKSNAAADINMSNGGTLTLSGKTVFSNESGKYAVENAGTIIFSGTIDMTNAGANFYNAAGGTLIWNLKTTTATFNGKQNSLVGHLDNSGTLVLQVNNAQTLGNYTIMTGDKKSNTSYTLKNGSGSLGTITVGGSSITDSTNQRKYTLVNSSGSYILKVEQSTVSITVTADSGEWTYDGEAHSKVSATVTSGELKSGDTLVVTSNSTITDAGTATNTLATVNVMRGSTDVTGEYSITKATGTLKVNARAVELTSNTASKMYDGTALAGTVNVTSELGFVDGEATASATSITNVSETGTNTITVNEGTGFKASNYSITKKEGTLTITARDVTLTSGDASKMYDGTELSGGAVTVGGSGFVDDEATATTGGITNVSETAEHNNTITVNEGTGYIAGNYSITKTEGTLTVTTRDVTLTSGDASKMYDGTELSGGAVTVGGSGFVDGEATATTGGITNVSETAEHNNTITVNGGTGFKADNYSITKNEGTLTVTARDVTLTSGSAEKEYDGTPLTDDTVTVGGSGFVGEEGATYNVTGSQTTQGSSANTFDYTLKNNTAATNYNITKEEGTLTVKQISTQITITVNNAEKVYDGTELTATYSYTDGILAAGDTLRVTLTKNSLTDAGEITVSVASYHVYNKNFEDVTGNYTFAQSVSGTLTVKKRAVELLSGSKGIDVQGTLETPLTYNKVYVVGGSFADGESVTYNVTGSQSAVGFSDNTFTCVWSDTVKESNYNVSYEYGTLAVSGYITPPAVTAPVTEGDTTTVTWTKETTVAAVDVALAKTGATEKKLNVLTTGTAVEIFNAASTDEYDVTAKNATNFTWTQGQDFDGASAAAPKEITSVANEKGDIFFANANGQWSGLYSAHNVGSKGSTWGGTGEYASLSGKNKITDIFTGSADGNILALTDSANGDALFMDDVYSALPTTLEAQKARVATIDEIRAGAGNDLIDLTSQRFDYATVKTDKTMKIRGGAGDDVIWGSDNGSMIFGDAGNDRLVGGAGNDFIAGGAGNDTMHGGSGSDTFTFCTFWGNDTVEQAAGAGNTVTLWFAEADSTKINRADVGGNAVFTHADTGDTVTVKGWTVADVDLKFGDDESAQYDLLVDAGCFLKESSENVFETEGKGVLAVI